MELTAAPKPGCSHPLSSAPKLSDNLNAFQAQHSPFSASSGGKARRNFSFFGGKKKQTPKHYLCSKSGLQSAPKPAGRAMSRRERGLPRRGSRRARYPPPRLPPRVAPLLRAAFP